MMPPGLDDQTPPQRQDSLPQDRPGLPSSKSSASAVSQPAPGSGGSATGPPQIKPLQTTKKLPKENDPREEDGEGSLSMLHERVTSSDISRVVAKATGIPVQNLLKGEREKLVHVCVTLTV